MVHSRLSGLAQGHCDARCSISGSLMPLSSLRRALAARAPTRFVREGRRTRRLREASASCSLRRSTAACRCISAACLAICTSVRMPCRGDVEQVDACRVLLALRIARLCWRVHTMAGQDVIQHTRMGSRWPCVMYMKRSRRCMVSAPFGAAARSPCHAGAGHPPTPAVTARSAASAAPESKAIATLMIEQRR